MDNNHNITSDISAANASLEANDQKQSKGEPPIHLELVNSPPSIDLDGEHGPKGTNSHVCCDPKDPQNWPEWKKNVQILMVSFHSLSSTFMTAGIVPATHTFSEQYGVSLSKASYLASAQILLLGVSPLLLWNAITARYGRYHVLLFSVLGGMACNIGGARCTSFAGQMTNRVLAAFIISPPVGIGSGVVTELCAPEKRGQKLGWWVLMTVLGTPLGPFIMGFVVQHAGVQWVFWIFAILNFAQAVAYLILGEETLYIRDGRPSNPDHSCRSRLRSLLPRRLDPKPFRFRDAFAPLLLVRYPKVLVPAVATSITFCYGNIVFVIEMPISFGEKFHFNSQQVGLQFISVIIGAVSGEQLSGPMSDYFLKARKKSKGHSCPADRLWLSYIGFATLITGLLVWGFQLEKAKTWNVTPCVGVAIASFGNQVQSTILTAYAVDSYKDLSSSIGVFISFVRLTYGFIGPFYFPSMFGTLGFGGAAGVMCAILAVGGLIPTIIIQVLNS